MFLHLGGDTIIPLKDVISITDLKNGKSDINKEFLDLMVEERMIEDVSESNPKCFIVTEKTVYISAISSTTLKKRAESMRSVGEDDF